MPVVDENSYAQFMQVMQGYTAQSQNFALAVMQMKQAKEEFKSKLAFQKETMDLERQRLQAEQGLTKTRLEAMQFELEAAKRQQKEQLAAEEEVAAFAQGPWARHLETVRTGDAQAIAQSALGVDLELGQLSPVGQRAWMGLQKMALENEWYEPTIRATIKEKMAQAQYHLTPRTSAGGIATSEDVSKNLQAILRSTKTVILGDDPDALTKRRTERLDTLNKQQEGLKTAIKTFTDAKGIEGVTISSALAAGNVTAAGSALSAMINSGKLTSEDRGVAEDLNQQLQNWRQESLAYDAEVRMDRIKENIANIFIPEYMGRMNVAAGAAESAALGVQIATDAATDMAPYAAALNKLTETQAFQHLGHEVDSTRRSQLAGELLARFREYAGSGSRNLDSAVRAMESALTGTLNPQKLELFRVTGSATAPVPTGDTISKLGGR